MTGRFGAAIRGSIGFLSRIPVGSTHASWEAFEKTPVAFPIAGYVIGSVIGFVVALTVARGFPDGTIAIVGLGTVYVVTGINHLDGLLDLGDAAIVHGNSDDRLEVLKDTTVGVGGVAAAGISLTGLALGFLVLARTDIWTVFGVVLAAEVGAKLTMAGIACVGSARHEGMGATFIAGNNPKALLAPILVSAPVLGLGYIFPVNSGQLIVVGSIAGAFFGSIIGGSLLAYWANGLLDGINGDVFGAANELARLTGIHAGVIVWTLL